MQTSWLTLIVTHPSNYWATMARIRTQRPANIVATVDANNAGLTPESLRSLLKTTTKHHSPGRSPWECPALGSAP